MNEVNQALSGLTSNLGPLVVSAVVVCLLCFGAICAYKLARSLMGGSVGGRGAHYQKAGDADSDKWREAQVERQRKGMHGADFHPVHRERAVYDSVDDEPMGRPVPRDPSRKWMSPAEFRRQRELATAGDREFRNDTEKDEFGHTEADYHRMSEEHNQWLRDTDPYPD